MDYLELKIHVSPAEPWIDLIIADLGELGFESFETNGNVLKAYVLESTFEEENIEMLLSSYKDSCELNHEISKIETVNWNKEWEKNFDPIFVDDKVVVRSSFHTIEKQFEFDILIDPKMSFGTGHHATTYLMMQKILELDFTAKEVLDMGCGTAVLAILAKMKGAAYTEAIDIDEWAYSNSLENVSLNNQQITVKIGGAELLGNQQFNVILANINLNILLGDVETYYKVLKNGGDIIFSGVLEHDSLYLKEGAEKAGLQFVEEKQRNNWMMFHFKKNL